jgi:hypothetical protein
LIAKQPTREGCPEYDSASIIKFELIYVHFNNSKVEMDNFALTEHEKSKSNSWAINTKPQYSIE